MKTIFLPFIFILFISLSSYVSPINGMNNKTQLKSIEINSFNTIKYNEAKNFCKANGLDTGIAFFVDMTIHSGKKRFFVIDLTKNSILYSGLCCHGMGMGSTEEKPVFSNTKGSNCTSLGKYKIGKRAFSNWGINVHYKMHGLESTNSNAFDRLVVLHSYDLVPESEIHPLHLPMGWSQGCPVISNKLMTKIDNLLKNKKRPVLLWIYK